jgi:hypothetical protein
MFLELGVPRSMKWFHVNIVNVLVAAYIGAFLVASIPASPVVALVIVRSNTRRLTAAIDARQEV